MILYFGNKLSTHGYTPTMIEQLLPDLEKRYTIISASAKLNPLLRLMEMIWVFIKNINHVKLILIDTYSTNSFYYTCVLAVMSSLFSKPYCPILHGGGLPSRLASSPRLSRFIFGKSFINISPSIYLKQIFEREVFTILHIPNFIEVLNYPMTIRKKFRPRILWVRSFHKIYNPVLAIYVLEKLLKRWNDTELCMVGPDKDGSMKDVIRLAKELNITNHLKITGKVKRKDWIELSKKYDIFINTSQVDNHPVTLLEIMALGLPIVTTNVGGIPSIIKNKKNGLLVNSNNAEEMANRISMLISGEIDGKLITRNARKEILELDKNKVIKKWYSLVDSFINSDSN